MPRVDEWLGIVFYMYADDHNPPHVHANYGDFSVALEIDTGVVLVGSLPVGTLRQARAWLIQNQATAVPRGTG